METAALRPLPFPVRLLRLQTDSSPECLTDARQKIRRAVAQTGLDAKALGEVEVAVGELLSNVHRHAYPEALGPLFVEVFNTQRAVSVIVIDCGCARVSPRLPEDLPDRRSVTGRGLYLVSRLSDDVKVCVNLMGHGLAVRITKSIETWPARTGRYHHAHVDAGASGSTNQQGRV